MNESILRLLARHSLTPDDIQVYKKSVGTNQNSPELQVIKKKVGALCRECYKKSWNQVYNNTLRMIYMP